MTNKENAKILASHPVMKQFLNRADIQGALRDEDFDALYVLADVFNFSLIGDMHWLFEEAGVNPLDYMSDLLPSKYCYGDMQLRSFKVPGKFNRIGYKCFAGAENLLSVELEEGVRGIGVGVFSGCTQLKSLMFPASLCEPLYQGTFRQCWRLKEINYGGDVLTAKNDVFSRSDILTDSAITKICCRDGYLEFTEGGTTVSVHHN